MKKKDFKDLLTSIDQARKIRFDDVIEASQPDWYKKIKKTSWLESLSQCPKCFCMTYTINGKCGKCKEKKSGKSTGS